MSGNRAWSRWLIPILLLFLCCSQVSAARIVSVNICESVSDSGTVPVGVRTVFQTQAPEIHAVVQMRDVKAGKTLKGTWVAVDAVKEPNYPIASSEVAFEKDGDATGHFSLSKPTKGWPLGHYKLEITWDGVLIASTPFSIEDAATAPASPQNAPEVVSILTCETVSEEGSLPANITDVFNTQSPVIHMVATVKNVRAGTRAKGVWIAIDAISSPNYEIQTSELTFEKEGTGTIHFSLTRPDNGWPPGHYKADLYLDGQMAGSAPFTIGSAGGTGESAQPAGGVGSAATAPASQTAPPPPAGPSTQPAPSSGPGAIASLDLGPPKPDPKRAWTIAVYMGGDNDLEPFALKDVDEMEQGLPEEGVQCVVLLDRAAGYSKEDGDWTDARVLGIRKNSASGIQSEVLASPGEVNMGDPALLQAFLTAVVRTYPAQHYALILWDHGGGWAIHLIDHNAPGAPKNFDKLTLPKLRQAVSNSLKETGLSKLDLLGFDMCLMAQLETAREISDLADIMIASEAVEPGDGWPYDMILPFFGKETMGSRRLAAQIVESYGKYYGDRKERTATLSALDLAEVPKLVSALDGLSAKLSLSAPREWSELSRSFFYAESYADRTDIRKGPGVLSSVDLLDMLRRLHHATADFPAEQEYQDIVSTMDRAVLAKYASPRHRLSHGLAIYAPVTGKQFSADYRETELAKVSLWPSLLAAVYQSQEKNLSTPRITGIQVVDAQSGKAVTGGKPGGGFRVEATVEGENILWVHSLQAIKDEKNNGVVILEKGFVLDPNYYKKKVEAVADVVDLIMPEFKGNQNKVSQEFVGRHLMVTNGEQASRATIDASNLKDLAHVAVPTLIKREGVEKHFATVFFNAVTWQAVNVIGEIPQPDGTVAYRPIRPGPEDEVTLLFEFIPDKGERSYLSGESFKWKNGLELLIENDSPGDVLVALRAESIGGQSAFAATTVHVEGYTKEEQGYVENARKVKLKDLIGTWQWHGLKDGKWKPLPAYTEIAPSKSNPDVLVAKIHNPSDPNWKSTPQVVILDTRLMPTLRLLTIGDDGQPEEAMNFTMLVSRWEKGTPRMVLKYLVPKGWLILWAKKQGTGATAASPSSATAPPQPAPHPPQGAPQPAPHPPQGAPQAAQPPAAPSAAGSLVGVWRSKEGEVLRISESTYEVYEGNQLLDGGAYMVRGSHLLVQSTFTGMVEKLSFSLNGRQLTLRDSQGEVSHYYRVK